MNPEIIYKCRNCNKIYTKFKEAKKCCNYYTVDEESKEVEELFNSIFNSSPELQKAILKERCETYQINDVSEDFSPNGHA